MKNKFIKSLMNSLNLRERERERGLSGDLSMKKESNGIGENKNSKKINKNNKIISSILAVVMCCQSFVGAGPPLNTDNTVDIVESSISKNENENENGLKGSEDDNENSNVKEDGSDNNKKSKGILEKIKDNCFELAVSGLGLVVLCAAGFALWFRKLNDKEPHSEINPGKIVVSKGGTLKVVLLGDSGVGKTYFFNRLLHDKFEEDTRQAFSTKFGDKMQTDNKNEKFKLRIFDTRGRENLRTVSLSYVRDTQVIFIFFDLNKKNGGRTNEDETIFDYLSSWVEMGKDRSPNAKFMFIGCKSDLVEENSLNDKEKEVNGAIEKIVNDNIIVMNQIISPLKEEEKNNLFFKTSAKSGDGFEEVQNAISSCVEVRDAETV